MLRTKTIILIQLANLIPLVSILALLALWSSLDLSVLNLLGLLFFWIYLLPPLLYRCWVLVRGKKQGRFEINSAEYLTWWVGVQFQVLFSRFLFLEEILKLIPMLYSSWLRLWGAKIGHAVYWSPQVLILDRAFINVGNFVVVGVGSKFTSHLVSKNQDGHLELLLESSRIGDHCILGGYCGVGPGSFVEEKQMLPSHFLLAPGYGWSQSGRQAPSKIHE